MSSITLLEAPAGPGEAATAFLARDRQKILIGSDWRDASGGACFEAIDPATGDVIAQVARGTSADVDAAVAAARKAFTSGPWPAMTPMERSQFLWKVADVMEANIDELAELETLDQGKALYVGRWAEIPGAVAQFRYFAGMATKIEGATIPTSINYQPEGKIVHAYTRREPVGVVGAILPWNSPLVLTAMKIAPALAAGCTMVLKPSEETSLTTIRLVELMQEAGLPEGVVNVVTGFGDEVGSALAGHMDVNKIVFTGSTATGRRIVEASQGNLKRVGVELGGKSPVIIMDDADLDAAIPGAANAGSRLYAHSSVYDRVVEGMAAQAGGIQLGHGLNPGTHMGPLVSKGHAGKVADFIADGKKAGASVICGGDVLGPNDSFVTPTVIADIKPDMRIVREEIFGPVVVVTRFDDADEVVAAANDSDYGLAAGVWTEGLSNATRMAERIHAGTVWINSHAMYDASLPIGGMKQSGYGRESGQVAMDNYLELKTVCAIV